ncbi:DnaB-like helicase C-terminal domain-containing protein [Staphylococcus pettenkoferi]|uniref:DnaB-like helicase C-terminal domain-containing protein n=1 Tax=Staphylococcus pettenkoferi TaxID=170573 RepID=UPI0022746067|nr:DnaB-like helicase C-terminal domain-containing protein [Staphylococcus pettenkoferi]MCY1563856.1 DnaB helicase C-terminal domain-containing protein [Staphylococcus pettenkoferi]
MTYRPSHYEITSRFGDMEYSIFEILFKKPAFYKDFKLTSEAFFDENLKKIIEFVERIHAFDIQQIITESKTNPDFVSYDFVNNLRQRHNDFIYSFIPYQKQLLERYKQEKAREIGQKLATTKDSQEINDLLESLNAYNQMTVDTSDNTEEIGNAATERLYSEDPTKHIIPTGFKKLDSAIGGFKLRTMSVIGANSGVGKTAFSLNIVWQMLKAGYDVTFLSLEMTGVDVFFRLASLIRNIKTDDILSGNISDEELSKVAEVFSILKKHENFHISDARISTREIRQVAQIPSEKPKVIFVDHLTYIRKLNDSLETRVHIANTTREITEIAKTTNTAIVCLAQLNRSNKQRQDKRPGMSDLKESGNIEEDSNTILLLHRDDYYDLDLVGSDCSDTKVIIAKNRDGGVGVIDMKFYKGVQKFYED